MALFKKCCFCVPLKPGCLIVAYMNLVGSIIGILISIYMLILGANFYGSPKLKEAQLGFTVLCVGVFLLMFMIASLSFSIVLLVGLHKNKPGLVKAYLIFTLVFTIIYAILMLVRLISGLGGFIEGIIHLLVSIYYLLVIKSYYMNMLENKHVNLQKV